MCRSLCVGSRRGMYVRRCCGFMVLVVVRVQQRHCFDVLHSLCNAALPAGNRCQGNNRCHRVPPQDLRITSRHLATFASTTK